jgi:hypothetical protein
MKIAIFLLSLLVSFGGVPSARADDIGAGHVERVETRGVYVPIYEVWNKDAVATLVLYSGGGGGFGKIGADGWPRQCEFSDSLGQVVFRASLQCHSGWACHGCDGSRWADPNRR